MRCANLLLLVSLVATTPAWSVVTRHDRDDSRYLALAKQFPATARLFRASHPNEPGDTGTLVASQWVLTAAHVAAGLRPGDTVEIQGIRRRIDRIAPHPDWHGESDFRFDIALCHLAEPFLGISPARIYDRSDELGMVATVVGHGMTGTGLSGPINEDGAWRGATNKVERVENSFLRFRFEAPGDTSVTELEGISGEGDSGGPAYIVLDGVQFVIGVSSAQDSSPTGRKRGRYGVFELYPRVSFFRDWIQQVLTTPSSTQQVLRTQ